MGTQLINDGPDDSIILLRTCLEQVNLAEDDQNLEVKLDFLALVIKNLIYQPNVGTVLCEALRILPFVIDEFLPNLSRALKLSLPEQIALAVALTEAEDSNLQQQGEHASGPKFEGHPIKAKNASWRKFHIMHFFSSSEHALSRECVSAD